MSDIVDADDIPTRIYFAGGGGMTVLPVLKLTDHRGRVWRFDWHSYMGPTFLRQDDEPLARFPSERNPMWKAFNLWYRQGRRVDADNNCIWQEADDAA